MKPHMYPHRKITEKAGDETLLSFLTLTNTYYNIHTTYVNPMCTYPKYSLTVLDIFLDILQFAMDMWPNG